MFAPFAMLASGVLCADDEYPLLSELAEGERFRLFRV